MAIDHSAMHLGKRPKRHDPRTLKLARYMTGTLPPAPSQVDYAHGIADWGMMLNDKLGCCTIAAVGHAVQTWTANAGKELTVPDSTILACYEKWDGYNPADPMTDQGGVELNVLNDWRQEAFNGHSLDAYVSIDLHDSRETANRVIGRSMDRVIGRSGDRVSSGKSGSSDQRITGSTDAMRPSGEQKQVNQLITGSSDHPISRSPDHPIPDIATAIWLFGGAYIGVELPISAQNQDVWDVPANPGPNDEPGSWGGHAVYVVGYEKPGVRCQMPGVSEPVPGVRDQLTNLRQNRSSTNPETWHLTPGAFSPAPGTEPPTLTCVTWGQLKKMTWAWFEKYCSEAYALVSKDWLNASGISPNGFDLATLEDDLKAVSCPLSVVRCN
jgi:hypothetical protein